MARTIDASSPEAIDEAIDEAAAVLEAGGVVVVPTDTVYGLAARAEHRGALYPLKGRPEGVPVAVLVADAAQAWTLARPSPLARRLAARFWPGPLTVVCDAEARWGEPTVGVRCPDHDLVRALAARVGPVATTSANRHGEPTPADAAAAAASLLGEVALVLDGGTCEGRPSTVVDATGDEPAVLRLGAIAAESLGVTPPKQSFDGER